MLEIGKDKQLYTIKNEKIIKLDENDLDKIKEILKKFEIELSQENPALKFLYRGENLEKIKSKLNSSGLDETFYKVFKLGEKPNSLFISSNKNNSNELYRVDCVNDDMFRDIFNKINKILINESTPKLKKFIENNKEFDEYFKDLDNIEDFIEKINLSNAKLLLKDYYMAFLHTEGNIIHDKSYFLSTSEKFDIAKKFSLNSNPDNQIVFGYFISKPFLLYGIFHKNKGYLTKLIKKCNLVSYSALHKKEEEFSIRGGFLPHYILYVKLKEKRKEKYIINPFIFVDEYNVDTNLNEGFPVDQENFIDEIRETNYNGYIEHNDGGITQNDL
ncbi:hypothetical protein [Halarcobacter anaerophilus]|uniref:Uncharacterized protein n=1 Tax=Halarcobacter anaerophilus TaxID=877500 RepID=A0A4Q0Y025_9BACT|nr:hypothetical protein [Halarcobacter anaerophilus]QDF29802.1 hypothetical protein AANAER_2345 [Halarcobacter anaerophilus]RXJ62765.1 hypothetical protein CRV06_07995 [Halarcobacter anaerophilus]